jgi:4-hydroxybenzoate polyprenyltransferase
LIFTRLLISVECTQLAIGAINDYQDRVEDVGTNRLKPIARGWIAPWEAIAIAIFATAVIFVIAPSLGILPFAILLLIEALGLSYDLWFKGTVLSGVLYAIGLPLSPLLSWSVFGRWQPFLPWLLPLGAALGIAMNVANTLPDLEADRAAGIRGLPHLLGLRRGLFVAWLTPPLVLAGILLLHVTGVVPARSPGLWLVVVAALLPSALAAALYRRRPVSATLRATFLLQGVGVILLAGGWIAAVAFS